MKFPNAAKGISKLFTSEILSLLGILILGATGIIYYASPALREFADKSDGKDVPVAGIIVAVLATIALIFFVVGAIIKIIGVLQTAKDEGAFKAIVYITIFAIVVSVVIAIVTGNSKSEISTGFSTTISDILNLITTFLVIGGISNLANKLGNEEMIAKGASIISKIFWMMILAVIANIIAAFTHGQAGFWTTVAVVLAVISAILSIVAYILYLAFLAQAKKMLQE